ncbi:MAG: hypothetical protein GOV15_04250, partial [Candidatus Diapherotrites archaeon]|nr:hypothetical protein [Candidatus Diapherotrites archaeon]
EWEAGNIDDVERMDLARKLALDVREEAGFSKAVSALNEHKRQILEKAHNALGPEEYATLVKEVPALRNKDPQKLSTEELSSFTEQHQRALESEVSSRLSDLEWGPEISLTHLEEKLTGDYIGDVMQLTAALPEELRQQVLAQPLLGKVEGINSEGANRAFRRGVERNVKMVSKPERGPEKPLPPIQPVSFSHLVSRAESKSAPSAAPEPPKLQKEATKTPEVDYDAMIRRRFGFEEEERRP